MNLKIQRRVLAFFVSISLIISFTFPVFASDEDLDSETGIYTVPEGTEEIKKNTVFLREKSFSDIKKIVLPETVKRVKKGAFDPDKFTSLKEIVIGSEKGEVVFEEGAIPENDSRFEGLILIYKTEKPVENPILKPEKKTSDKEKIPEPIPETITGKVTEVANKETSASEEKPGEKIEIMVSEGTKKGNIISVVITIAVAISFFVIGFLKFRPAPSY